MTHQQEVRYKCDRCDYEANVPLANGPAALRFDPPQGWMTLRINNEPGQPPGHLCANCSADFRIFMGDGKPRYEAEGPLRRL